MLCFNFSRFGGIFFDGKDRYLQLLNSQYRCGDRLVDMWRISVDEAQDENIDVNAIVGDRGRRGRSKTGMSAGGALGS